MNSRQTNHGVQVRKYASLVLFEVIERYRKLDQVLEHYRLQVHSKDHALLQALCYGVMRWQVQLEVWMKQLTHKPNALEPMVKILILLGLYQLTHSRIPAYAAIDTTVESAKALKIQRAKGLINALLRQFQKLKTSNRLQQNIQTRYAHPLWMIKQLQADWPHDWQAIMLANNVQAPMTLRVDTSRLSREAYLHHLSCSAMVGKPHEICETAIVLEQAVDIKALPGFAEGLVSVQDAGAQLAIPLLNTNAQQRILDACAAPGGKTAHLLQQINPRQLTALDRHEQRFKKLSNTLDRIGITADIQLADANDPMAWWDKQPYDRILLDAPCSACGVIRRHPDIKHLRSPKALDTICQQQQQLLDALWPLLRPGGQLLYASCSVFRKENDGQISQFLQHHHNASLCPLNIPGGHGLTGQQIFPGSYGMDGFYYALVEKH